MPVIKYNIDLYSQNWERLLEKKSFRGYKVNRFAAAVLNKDANELTFKSTGDKIQISFNNQSIHLDRIANSKGLFSFARIKHWIRLHFGNYRKQHNEKIQHLANLITEKLKLDKDVRYDNQEVIPLIDAFEREDFDRAEELIRSGVNLNCINQEGRTPLMLAALNSQPELVKLLIASGARVNEVDSKCSTPLMYAIEAEDIEIVQLMLAAKADVNAIHASGGTPLFLAVANRNEEIVEELLNQGANVHTKIPSKGPLSSFGGFTALHFAVTGSHLEIINKLINAGCDIHAQNNEGVSSLSLAMTLGNKQVINKLLECRA